MVQVSSSLIRSVQSDEKNTDIDIDNLDGKEIILNQIGILFDCRAATLQEC